MKRLFLGLVALLALSLLVTRAQTPGAQPEFCITSPSQTANYNQLCMSVTGTGAAIGVTNFGSATGSLAGGNFSIKSPPCNAVGDGVADDTAAIIACEAARPVGSTMVWSPGTYSITGDITAAKAGAWDMQGVTVNSVQGRFILPVSNFTLNGGKSTLNFDPGSLGSNGRAVRLSGSRFTTNGSNVDGSYSVTGNIAIGATSFVTTAPNIALASLVAGDWIQVLLVDTGGVPQAEVKQVISVTGGTTVNVNVPFAQGFINGSMTGGCSATAACWPIGWIKYPNPIQNVEVNNLNVVITSAASSIGLDMQPLVINGVVRDNTFYVNNGIAMVVYHGFNPQLLNNVIWREGARTTEVSQTYGGRISGNKWWSQGTANGAGLNYNSGGYGLLIDHNEWDGRGGSGVVNINDVANTIFDHNIITCGGTGAIGTLVFGGANNALYGNSYDRCDEGTDAEGDAGTFANGTWLATNNIFSGNAVRNANNAVNVAGVNAIGTRIVNLDTDGTVTTQVADSGTGTLWTAQNNLGWRFGSGNISFPLGSSSAGEIVWDNGTLIVANSANLRFINQGDSDMVFDNLGFGTFLFRGLGGATVLDYGNLNAGRWTFPASPVSLGLVLTAAAPTVAAAQIGYGSTTVAAGASTGGGTCPTGTVGGAAVAGCVIVNIAGTARGVPFF